MRANVSNIFSPVYRDDNESALILGCFSLGIYFGTILKMPYITRCKGCNAKRLTLFPPFEIDVTSNATKLALLIFFFPSKTILHCPYTHINL